MTICRRMLVAGTIMFGALWLTGCVTSPGDGDTGKGDSVITLAGAHLVRDGDSVLVTGQVDGVEMSVRATELTIDGVASSFDGASVVGTNAKECYFCVCDGGRCTCKPARCPVMTVQE